MQPHPPNPPAAAHRRRGSLVLAMFATVGIILTAGFAACGRTLPPAGIGGAPSPSTTTGATLATGTPTSATPSPQTSQSGVTVALDRDQYATSIPVIVTIHNALTATIITADHQSQCSIVTLQRDVNGAWQAQNRCELMIMTRMIPLAEGSATTVKLMPRTDQSSVAAWPAGTYRVAFAYFTGTPTAQNSAGTVYSATFTIV